MKLRLSKYYRNLPQKNIIYIGLSLFLLGAVSLVAQHLVVRKIPLINAQAVGTEQDFKVAFIGDQGPDANADNVLNLIKNEGADMVLHQGDFDYDHNPTAWDNKITSILGANFAYFASIGNHDVDPWPGYQQKLTERLSRVSGAICTGDYGVNAACIYKGLFFILSGVGTMGENHDTFIHDQLAANTALWSICSWHKNQNAMQIGGKNDETDWLVYEECRNGGAIIATAHEHSYERTKTLIDMTNQIVDPACSSPTSLCVDPGKTFVFVSGLGGNSIRNQDRCKPTSYPYGCKGEWASIYTSNQHAKFGALFIIFNYNGDPYKAHGYFKNVQGEVVDEFDIVTTPSEPTASPTPSPTIDPMITPADTPTPTPTPQVSIMNFNPTADSHVSLRQPTKNFGTSTTLLVDGDPVLVTYMKFDLGSLVGRTLISAKLRIKITGSSSSVQNIKNVDNITWSETGITYNNRPPTGSTVNTISLANNNTWKEADVTAGLAGKLGQFVSLGIDSTGTDGLDFNSRESTVDKPELVLTYH